jgi:MFS family permease
MQVSDTVIGAVTGIVFSLTNGLVALPVAWLADRWNRRNIIAAGLAFWSAMTAATGLVANIWQLALARLLMGAGEAASMAPSNSMIADLFSKVRRSFAVAVLVSGNPLSSVIFVPIAAWAAASYGWRAAFFVAGIPGLALSLLFYATVREPERGLSDARAVPASTESWRACVNFLSGSRSYILLLLGATLLSVNVSLSAWYAAFFDRVFHLPITQIGIIVGPGRGIAGLAAVLLGGLLVDILGRDNDRWRFRLPGFAAMLAAPGMLVFLLSSSLSLSVAGLVFANFCSAMTQGAAYAACSNLAKVRMRATAVAIFTVFVNVIGYSAGPFLSGLIADLLQPRFGEQSIRYGLLIGAAAAGLGGLCYWLAARTVVADMRRAAED